MYGVFCNVIERNIRVQLKVFIWVPDQSAFYAYAHIMYVHSIRITEHKGRIWTSVHTCTRTGTR